MASPETKSAAPINPTEASPALDELESPSTASTNALARYEYEAGHTNVTQCTKILMVEWEDDDTTRGVKGDWHISWHDSTRVLPANDQPANDVHRMYFLLPPGIAVPASITLTLRPQDVGKSSTVWHTNPLPALFPPELGASARAAGRKGVLHTIWAKSRIAVLQKEIEAELRNNVEGLGLMMAVQEKEWIEHTFGVTAKPASLSLSLAEPASSQLSKGPATPRSPGGGRLMDRLASLRLGTSEKDLTPADTNPPFSNPLSPESSDIAISSFAAFKGAANPSSSSSSSLDLKSPQTNTDRTITAHVPPPSIIAQQPSSASGMGFLDHVLSDPIPTFQSRGQPKATSDEDDDTDEGLFALPIATRNPK